MERPDLIIEKENSSLYFGRIFRLACFPILRKHLNILTPNNEFFWIMVLTFGIAFSVDGFFQQKYISIIIWNFQNIDNLGILNGHHGLIVKKFCLSNLDSPRMFLNRQRPKTIRRKTTILDIIVYNLERLFLYPCETITYEL